MHNFTRPDESYAAQPLPNSNQFQLITQVLRKPVSAELYEANCNYAIDALNLLDSDINNLVVGTLPGIDDPDNYKTVLGNLGDGSIFFTKVTGDYIDDQTINPSSLLPIGSDQIDSGAVTPDKIPNNSLLYSKLNLADNTIPSSKILYSNNSLAGSVMQNSSITELQMAPNSIGTPEIINGSVTIAKFGADAAALLTAIQGSLPPIGSGYWYFGTGAPPATHIEATGQLLNRTTYASLFAAYGTLYGVGDGYTTFGIPDMRGVTPVGIGTDGSTNGKVTNATAANITVGGTFGEQAHTLTINEMPRHNHQVRGARNASVGGSPNNSLNPLDVTIDTSYTGGSAPHNNMQPGMFARFFIRAL